MIRGGLVRIFVRDVQRAVRFYVETLGMKLSEEEAGFAIIDAGEGFLLGLHRGAPCKDDRAPAIGLFPKLPIDEAVAILENRGVVFDVKRGSVTLAWFRDPDENRLYLRGS